jgi:outer membrane protein assembly factor BamB
MEGPVQAAPVALADGWLIVDVFGHMQRFDFEFNPIWTEPYDCGAGVFRQPTIDGNQALVSTANDQVISIDLTKGTWRWSHKRSVTRGDQDLAILGAPAPTVVGDAVVQGFSDGFVVGIDRDNGSELWALQVGDGRFPDIQAEVIEYDGMLIVAAFGGPTVALDASTQTVRWRVDSGAVSTMSITDEGLYISTGRGALLALDPRNGTTQWRWEPKDKQLGPPVRVGSSLFVGDSTGTVHAVDRYEGKELWRYRPHDGTRLSGVAGAATAEGRQLLFVSAGGSVHALIGASSLAGDLSEEPRVRRDRQLGW